MQKHPVKGLLNLTVVKKVYLLVNTRMGLVVISFYVVCILRPLLALVKLLKNSLKVFFSGSEIKTSSTLSALP